VDHPGDSWHSEAGDGRIADTCGREVAWVFASLDLLNTRHIWPHFSQNETRIQGSADINVVAMVV